MFYKIFISLFLIFPFFSITNPVFSQYIIYDSTQVIFSSPQYDYYNISYQNLKFSSQPGFILCEKRGSNNSNIVYKLEFDGYYFSPELYLTNDSYQNLNPFMSLYHAVWQSNKKGNYNIYYAEIGYDSLINKGAIDSSQNDEINPCIIYISNLEVLFYEKNNKIYYRIYSNSWGSEYYCSSEVNFPCFMPKAVSTDSVINLCFLSQINTTTSRIYVKKGTVSTNGGINWQTAVALYQPGSQRNINISRGINNYLFYDYDTLGSTNVFAVNFDTLNNKYVMTSRFSGNNISGAGYNLVTNLLTSYQNLFTDFSWIRKTSDSTMVMIMKNINGNEFFRKFYLGNNTFDSRTVIGYNWGYDSTYRKLDISWEQMLNEKRAIVGSWYRQTTGINYAGNVIPDKFNLSQNYPNPFNPSTKIRFDIPKASFVKLKVIDILGREIETLVDDKLQPGIYEVNWNALQRPSGVYFYQIQSGNFNQTKKMVLIK